jgi:uncharacterized OsmC-like protein
MSSSTISGIGGEYVEHFPRSEVFASRLGACIAYYIQQFCQARGLPYDSLGVEVEQDSARAPHRISLFVVRVILPTEFPEEKRAMVELVARNIAAPLPQ